MKDGGARSEDEDVEEFDIWGGVCVVEDGVLYIEENPHLRFVSGIKGFGHLLLSILVASMLLYTIYQHPTGSEFRAVIPVTGIFGVIYVLLCIYGDYLSAYLPWNVYTKEKRIRLDDINQVSAYDAAGNINEEPTLSLTFLENGVEREREIKFKDTIQMGVLEKFLNDQADLD